MSSSEPMMTSGHWDALADGFEKAKDVFQVGAWIGAGKADKLPGKLGAAARNGARAAQGISIAAGIAEKQARAQADAARAREKLEQEKREQQAREDKAQREQQEKNRQERERLEHETGVNDVIREHRERQKNGTFIHEYKDPHMGTMDA